MTQGWSDSELAEPEPILLWLSQEHVPGGSGTNFCYYLVARHGVSMGFSNCRR